jgi:hypothetical protein
LVIPVGEVPGNPESKFPQISLHLSCVRQPADMSPPGYKLPCQVFTSRNCQVNNDKQLPTGFQCLASTSFSNLVDCFQHPELSSVDPLLLWIQWAGTDENHLLSQRRSADKNFSFYSLHKL